MNNQIEKLESLRLRVTWTWLDDSGEWRSYEELELHDVELSHSQGEDIQVIDFASADVIEWIDMGDQFLDEVPSKLTPELIKHWSRFYNETDKVEIDSTIKLVWHLCEMNRESVEKQLWEVLTEK